MEGGYEDATAQLVEPAERLRLLSMFFQVGASVTRTLVLAFFSSFAISRRADASWVFVSVALNEPHAALILRAI